MGPRLIKRFFAGDKLLLLGDKLFNGEKSSNS
jgi:hypothetical protein